MTRSMLAGMLCLSPVAVSTVLLSAGCDPPAVGQGPEVTAVAPMRSPRAAHQATVLPDGTVLVTGGCTGGSCRPITATAELFEPATGRFRQVGRMIEPRSTHLAAALPDGRVLLAGGWSGEQVLAGAEVYDPQSGLFTTTGSMTVPRMGAVAARLHDGRILVMGGQPRTREMMASSEVYDPATGTFSATGAMSEARSAAAATTLLDGTVLVTGGSRARGVVNRSAERYDPRTGTFRSVGEMRAARHKHAMALLPDGRVLVIGGSDARDSRGRYATTEIYDPVSDQFSAGPTMRSARYKIVDAVATLSDGRVLVAGDADRPELYDPATGQFALATGASIGTLAFTAATALPDGRVLLLGGYDEQIQPTASAWLTTFAEPGARRGPD